ncbi:S-layer homology domain-containing protein [Anaerobacterium chartisolvens]|uniref:S-layer homology domain-containing protein n=1 Tax=Anaerobacterium chartisolvens TaxID=1297424 RepID=UPI000DF1F61A|nr:S-layer homology domain-containing protein [Anaerobacterium chartisolvens]
MNSRKYGLHKILNIKRWAVALLSASIVLSSLPIGTAAAETAEAVYTGVTNADVLINNMAYTDVKSADLWIREAVYETGVLELLKGYGDKNFGLSKAVSKEEAITKIYTAAGREAEAQVLAQNLDNARSEEDKKKNTLSMWADGFLQLAANEGLITANELADALDEDQAGLEPGDFHRGAAAQRQEVAYWLARALGLVPVYNQQSIFNNFNDWKSADPVKVPFIEAVLSAGIMNGNGKGSFNPASAVTRTQLAQIIKNSEGLILPAAGLGRRTGIVEEIRNQGDYSGSTREELKTIDVRNTSGRLHRIELRAAAGSSQADERSGKTSAGGQRDIVVYKNGTLGKSSLLKTGDRIEYIVSQDNTVRFVKVLSSIYDTKYYVATINNVDTANLLMNTSVFFKLDYPDFDLSKANISFAPGNENAVVNYRYSANVSVDTGGRGSGIVSVTPETYVILTVKDNIVTAVKYLELGQDNRNTVVRGIVEDNNPELGYITLYNEDGTGNSPGGAQRLLESRTYNYGDQNDIEVFKNHQTADLEDIEPGDTVFLKLDGTASVVSVSGVDNYTVKYGKVLSRTSSTLGVQYDDGTQQVLDVDGKAFIVYEGRAVSMSKLQNGDRVKLLLSITNKATVIKEITIEGDEHFISNIYKGKVSKINTASGRISIDSLQRFTNGKWVRTEQKGTNDIRISQEYKMYFDNRAIDTTQANKYFKQAEAYIAVEKDYGGQERAVLISFRNEEDTEDVPYDDSVSHAYPSSGQFSVSKKTHTINGGEGTIVVKDGRLVSTGSISEDDKVYVVANRSYDTGSYYAGVVQIGARQDDSFVQIYRARIKKINENSSFTVESFSQLNGTAWSYSNTPKTFNITYNTRIVGDEGVVGQRDFTDYGDNSYANRTVYIVADNLNALLVTTAPYGTVNARGRIYSISGGDTGAGGTIISQPTDIKLTEAKVYGASRHMWLDSKDMELKILPGSIILKDKKVAKPSELKNGDKIRVIKRDSTTTGEAYIIIVEN